MKTEIASEQMRDAAAAASLEIARAVLIELNGCRDEEAMVRLLYRAAGAVRRSLKLYRWGEYREPSAIRIVASALAHEVAGLRAINEDVCEEDVYLAFAAVASAQWTKALARDALAFGLCLH